MFFRTLSEVKSETISNVQNNIKFKTTSNWIPIRRFGFSGFEVIWLRFVSDFDIRISDFHIEVCLISMCANG
jgi:hypothetical protein